MPQARGAARWTAGWLAAVLAAGCAQILGADWDSYTPPGAHGGGGAGGSASGQGGQSGGPEQGGGGGVAGGDASGAGGSGTSGTSSSGSGTGGNTGSSGSGGGDSTSSSGSGGSDGSGGSGGGVTAPSCATSSPETGPLCGPPPGISCCDSREVPGGTFNRNNNPAFAASVSSFHLDTFEITVGRFRAFMESGHGVRTSPPAAAAGEHPKIPGSGWQSAWNEALRPDVTSLSAALSCTSSTATWTPAAGRNEALPINCITWYEAFAFCVWDRGRLPTDAEWNYAAVGGNMQRKFPWGDMITHDHASYACAAPCALSSLLEVGSLPLGRGRWGQFDLSGNVSEWALDWAVNYTVPWSDQAQISDVAGDNQRTRRGGYYASDDYTVSNAHRGTDPPTVRGPWTSARCARDLPP
ncbi:formylglycine-generating enzyme family protein [Sorangium atrum]|uniref:SUMF1/EgtB/PvdO family nonheme iron enzyme n=1 Tax=Sorangium atrum TaxID=2995308 RepID=A0ABT5C1H7_9BACT|nr:SUMF1/EgtB/PvdO family nonheme iron enzyme [Sorangium aterium]MDC0680265.1 SUMF1/EgtB/PvdO family nonheme iron enzyme [Sorangium aterium]